MTFSPGDRIIVTMPRSAPREGEYVEDRGRKCKVLLAGDTETCVVLRERVRAAPVKKAKRLPDGARCSTAGCERMRGYYLNECYEHAGPDPYAEDDVPMKPALRAVPKPPKPLRSDRYLAFVRKHACCAPWCTTRYDRVEAHHFGPHGMSVKCDDYRTVALCHTCHHAEFHAKGTLRGCNREETERAFMLSMRELLMEWFGTERDGGERDTVIVEALINHLRESQT